MELIEDGTGGYKLEKVPEKKDGSKLGIEYGIGIRKIDDKNAYVLGWRSPNEGWMPCDEGASGRAYAPNGFKIDQVVFVKINDAMVTASQMDINSIDSLLSSLEKAEALNYADLISKCNLVGKITFCW